MRQSRDRLAWPSQLSLVTASPTFITRTPCQSRRSSRLRCPRWKGNWPSAGKMHSIPELAVAASTLLGVLLLIGS